MKTAGIYIHFPFCENKSIYCDYYSLEKREKDIPYFVEMLMREIELTAKDHKKNWFFDTIYFGGGSPALLSPNNVKDILNKLNHHFNISETIELTVEVNPRETTKENLFSFKELGINRLSIGFQSLDPDLLTTLSRTHIPDDCFTIYEDARDAGFENISVDMMYNIPGQSVENWLKDLKILIEIKPDHIAAYPLIVEEGIPLFNRIKSGEIIPLPEGTELEMFTQANKFLANSGFIQYEIAHFTKSGKECKHNQHYWNLEPYLAFGPSAHGYDGRKRWWNVSSLDDYLSKLFINEKPVIDCETLSSKNQFNETVIYGLRTNNGISMEKLRKFETKVPLESSLKKWKDHLKISKEAICIKSGHYHLADEIATDMMVAD